MMSIRELAEGLDSGAITATELVEGCIDNASDPAGEGSRAFLALDAAEARATAAAIDAQRRAGVSMPPFSGIPAAMKDLCDLRGQVTKAGSVVLGDRPPAAADAPVAARLRAAGFVLMGRTNMTEFAYSGLGLNAHYDTPRAPWDRAVGHIPGGSSSGTAVAVADEMAVVGLGTDTGGSCRIPAAFCGITGYKPTARRIPLDGIVPLAPSLDSVGPLGRSVDCCAIVDDLFAGGDGLVDQVARPADRIRLAVITDFVLDGIDKTVAEVFERSLGRLSAGGIDIVEVGFPELDELPTINGGGGLATAEAYHWHRELIAAKGDHYDQRVRTRIEPGQNQSAADYLDLLQHRERLIAAAAGRLQGFDAFVLPTVAIVPPTIDSFADGDRDYYSQTNLLCLRNTAVGNFLDACAISLPASDPGLAPVGLMLMAGPEADHQLFSLARTVESLLKAR